MRPALFLDRDGTIIEERNYLRDPDGVVLIPGAIEVVGRAHAEGYIVVVVTNQSGVGRGYMTQDDVRAVNSRVRDLGIAYDAVYYCPHRPDDDCRCRKPKPGMALDAARDFDIDLGRSIVVGDSVADVELGRAIGARTVLVRTGHGRQTETMVAVETIDSIADLTL